MHDGKITEKVSRSILKVGVIVLVFIMLTALFETSGIATASADTFTTPADEALYIEDLESKIAADDTGDIKNITAEMKDGNLDKSFKIEPGRSDYKVITMKLDDDPSDYSQIVLQIYVTSYKRRPDSVRIYAYQSDENNVNTGAYVDYRVNDEEEIWYEWDVTDIAHSMDGYNWMKFRITYTGREMGVSEGRFSLTPMEDVTPPASVTNLVNITYEQTYISWTWNNPPDPDFSHVMVYLDGDLKLNTSEEYYNATGLAPETSHEISTKTVDTSGNINAIWVNHTATTAPVPNAPPVLDPIGDKTVDEGSLLEFRISATDPDGDELTYSASNLLVGASFDAVTRTFSWTPTYEQAGSYPDVCFEVSDGLLTDSEDITITVNDVNRAPILDAIGDKTVDEGSLLEFTVTASDPDEDPLTYSASNLPAGATFANATFSWTPTYEQAEIYPDVCFEVSDGVLTDSEDVTITVNDVDIIPPNVTINTPTPDWYNANFMVNATVTDNVGVNTVQFRWETISAQGIWQPMTHQAGTDYWTATFDISTVIDGNHTIRVNATDDSTNEGTQTVVEIGIDTTRPMVSDLTPADSSYVTTATPTISATISDAAPSSAINAGSIVMTVDGAPVAHAYVDGVVSYTPLTTLAEGIRPVTVDVSDNAGNIATTSWSFTVDTVDPEITINPVTTPTSVDTQMVTGTYTEANLATIVVNDVTATITDGSWSASVSLSEGSNTITATATDQVGHTATATDTIVLDTVPPEIGSLTPEDGAYIDTATPTISATILDATPNSGIDETSIVMTVDGLPVEHAYVDGVVSYTPSELAPLADDAHTVTVDVSDNAGNPATASWSFTVDTVDPVVTIADVTTPTNELTQTITGSYVEVNLDTIVVNGVSATIADGTFSAPDVPLSEGSNTITVTAVDLAGNDGTAETTIFLDTEAPTFIVSASPDPATTGPVTMTVTASEALSAAPTVTVTQYLGTPTAVTMTLSTGTTYTGTYTVVTGYDGVATIDVSGTDLAGNTGTGTGSFVVDTTPPPIPTMDAEPAYTPGTSNIVSWGAVVDAGVSGEEYYVEYCSDGTFTTILGNSGWITATSYEFTGLTDGVTYYYHVKSRDAFEQESAWSDAVWSTQDDSAPTTADDASPDWTNLDVTVALTATDVGSGVFETYYTTDGSDPVTSTTRTLYIASFILTETGQYRLKYYSVDNVGNAETVVTGTLVKIDKVIPSTSDDAPAKWQTSPFTITVTVTDTGGSPTTTYYKIWSTGDVEPVSYTEGTTIPVTVDGEYYVKYYTSDEAGNEEAAKTATNTAKLDTIAPTGTISINADATYTTSVDVTLTLTYSDDTSGVDLVRYSNDGVWDTELWESPSDTKSWTLTAGDETKTVYYQIKDNAGLLSTTYSDDIILDTTPPPVPTMDAEPTYTAGTSNTVSWGAVTDLTSGMKDYLVQKATDSEFTLEVVDSEWITGTSQEFTGLADGQIYYYRVKARDNVLLESGWSDPVSSTQDDTLPTGMILINADATYTTSVDVALTLSALDDTSGVAEMCFSDDGVTYTEWETYATSKSWALTTGDGAKTVYVRYRDNAGLESSAYSDDIILDITPPTISNLQPADGETVYENNVTVYALLSDAGSGIDTETIVVKIDGVELSYDINRTNDGMEVFIISERRWLTEGNHSATINVSDKMNRANQTTWSFTVKATYYEIALELGWNLISLPLIPENSSIEAVLEGVSNVVSVWTYDAATGNWYVYSPGSAANTLTEMKDGPGYWVMMDGNTELAVRGVTMYPGAAVPQSYPVYEGWNLIGFKSTEEMTAEAYLASVWSLFEKPWPLPIVYYPGDDFYSVWEMEPCHGYWLYMTADGEIVPPASQREEGV